MRSEVVVDPSKLSLWAGADLTLPHGTARRTCRVRDPSLAAVDQVSWEQLILPERIEGASQRKDIYSLAEKSGDQRCHAI